MENTDFDIVIEKARVFRERFVEKVMQDNEEKGIETDEKQLRDQITIKILGEIEIEEEGKKVKKHVFSIKLEGELLEKIYDEDLNFMGAKLEGNQKIILPMTLSSKTEAEREAKKKELDSIDFDSAKTLEEAEADNAEKQKEKEEKVAKDLEQNTGDTNLEIHSYRRVIDPAFFELFPEVSEGAQEIGTVLLNDGRVGIVANYGDGFQIGKSTELASPPSDGQVYNIDRESQSVQKDSLYSEIPMKNGKSVGINFGQYGYHETKIIHNARDDKKVAIDLQQQGDNSQRGTTSAEREEQATQGSDYAQNTADLLSGEQNDANDIMKQHIVDSILSSHKEQLEDLYGINKSVQEAGIRSYIEKAVKEKGITVPIEIQRDVEINIEWDHELTVLRGKNSH